MDKKDGGNIDLASLRGFTPGPWSWWTSCSFDRLSSRLRMHCGYPKCDQRAVPANN